MLFDPREVLAYVKYSPTRAEPKVVVVIPLNIGCIEPPCLIRRTSEAEARRSTARAQKR